MIALLSFSVPASLFAQPKPAAKKPSVESETPKPAEEAEAEPQLTPEEIKKHVETGQKSIELKDWETAVKELEQAVKAEPENGSYHHALGVAYMGARNANAGWFHFRQAVRLAPDYLPATVDFLGTWKLLDAQGLFNVGTPLDFIIRTLGKPDEIRERGPRMRVIYGFMSLNLINRTLFSVLDLRNLPEEGLNTTDGLAFTIPDDWKVAYRILSATQGNTEYVHNDETIQNWTELFASQRFIGAAEKQTAKSVREGIRTRLVEAYPKIDFKVLEEGEGKDTLFQWGIPGNAEHPAQYEVVRLVQGENDIHRLAYTRKADQPDDNALKPWLEVLRSARLLPAEELREHQQREGMERQLLQITRALIERQQEMIREKNVDLLKSFFVEEKRDEITADLLEQIEAESLTVDPESFASRVELVKAGDSQQAELYNEQGDKVLTLVQREGNWYASNLWFRKTTEKTSKPPAAKENPDAQ
ncbi:tetratricopeptide repeat protein [Rubinisphaera margarita]|uniref:tetratricopeptide repeat protein n=1 Tax=Rubinisphaera margarita TaxID=2909586 RepID=UPI001EE7DD9C|nr:hypothetical protein [Rubinisphaera margarita]MCG6158400.1 hypothetical protein [Rubinisphaera margarita]